VKTPAPESATILLVDDEDAVQKLLTYPLEHEGFRVVQARDGEEALRRFDGERVDLVVLDLMLPKVDGLEVCRRLRAKSSVPIIMLTARDDELDKVVGLEIGADDYITKPFSIREFRSRVRALLRRASLGPQGSSSTSPSARRRSAAGTWSSPMSSSSSCGRSPPGRGASSRGRRCSSRSGATTPTASPARSTCTSATCARSSTTWS
jgi:DNA-binding response OmpR family regulator